MCLHWFVFAGQHLFVVVVLVITILFFFVFFFWSYRRRHSERVFRLRLLSLASLIVHLPFQIRREDSIRTC